MPYDYDPSSVEAKWRKRWEEARAYTVDLKSAKNPYYSLVMFPYPSGDKLHVGHWYNFAPADSWSRYMRMHGKQVFAPIGFDAFGLPAENYAVKTGVPPAKSTAENVKTMIKQLKRIGTMYDWEKMVNTSDPSYYQWTQWLFIQMFKNKLAYKKLGNVNFCPSCQTVLANEQVWEGKCERCGTEVQQKALSQWYWKITQYSQKLLDNLDGLEWPEKTKLMQKNWIGRSEGAEISFDIKGHDEKIKVFTTRQDTLFGATFIVLAPEHPLVDKITPANHQGIVRVYKEQARKKTELQRTSEKVKTGEHTGAYAINPVNGKEIPIWIADYVLLNYGTGAVMGVPGHDERDFDFAEPRQDKGLHIQCVIEPDAATPNFLAQVHPNFFGRIPDGKTIDEAQDSLKESYGKEVLEGKKCWKGEGKIINSDFLNGLTVHEAKKKMIAWLENEDRGRGIINYRLRDWLVSRQRYWGAPIPIVYDPEGNAHPVPEEHLPWMLPTDVEFKPTGKSPLTESKEFIARTEKIFGKGWRPEFDTMDTFVCSSFYYLRYLTPPPPGPLPPAGERGSVFVDPAIEKKWLPVSMYIGGPEHACMHLIYARFVMMALKDFGFVSHEEPFQKLVHQGLITNNGAKMSKSKGNVVSPDSFVERYGSDVFRMYLMFMGPFRDGGDWSDTGIKGIDRFVQKVWRMVGEREQLSTAADSKEVTVALHQTIKKVTESMEKMHFNTAISALMEFLNAVEGKSFSNETAQMFARLISPIAPHLAEELWEALGGPSSAKATEDKKDFVIDQSWPTYDPKLLVTDTMTIAVQVNGKLRGQIDVASDASEKDILAAAKAEPHVQKYLEGQVLKKEIYIKGRLVSLVI
ncbi:leucine--tRNA ligase [Candidatus Peribacteria bacterium]|nr:leucine--tRNA ligase [Candidatus Peribacteria bacterium]